jgi:hypothetical protein
VVLDPGKTRNASETELAKELRLLRERMEGVETKLHKIHAELPAQFGKPPEPK